MRLLIAAGGTGGHLIPAIRIAEAIVRQRADAQIMFVGSDRGFEERVVATRGYQYVGLPARGLVRRRWWRNLGAAWANLRATRMARTLVRDWKPDVGVGCGGYAAYFPMRACRNAGIPYVIQEQNRLPGLATRWLSKKAEVTFIAFPETASRLRRAQSVEVVGNPVDPRLAAIDRTAARRAWDLSAEARVILVTGGSSGARSINRNVARGLKNVSSGGSTVLLWQTGMQGADWDGRAAAGWTVRAFPFTDLMTEAFVAADLIVARAGALTISEICAAGRAAILVPYPFATADHQAANARVLVDAGAAIAIEDRALDDKSLLAEANLLLSDRVRVAKMESAAQALARPQAADQIAARVIAISGV